ncbi:hypothetical protein [Bordetella sp. N]|uniref:hypothetical protein n=1 Tax=Bordetella sp. N TaxID=1746199 RepID=UPI00070BEE00|nr:hypothetical protein [Bordetella sp. N]ALM85924.1 hypothetical protein ASB57_25915 [Bordetella sp. N]
MKTGLARPHWIAAAVLGVTMATVAVFSPAADAGKETAMTQTNTVTLGATRYAIPKDYLDGPLEFKGEKQGAVLLRAMLPSFTPDSGDYGGKPARLALMAILLREPAVKNGVVQDVLEIDYRLYVGDLTPQGMQEPAHPLEPAFDGLRRVIGRDESTDRWKTYPDVYIEGDEQHPTLVMSCTRAGVGVVKYPNCNLGFMDGQTQVNLTVALEHAERWRELRADALNLLAGFRKQSAAGK